jgi:peptide/nickel transport system substrate-binding protein
MRKPKVFVFIVLSFLILTIMEADAANRTALVIGNADYKLSPLKNPVNDAKDMAAILKESGFKVTLKMNATKREMENSVRKFGKTLRNGGVGLFYYAGHGMQLKGRNYLIPINALIESESDVEYESLDAGRVLGKMEDAGNDMNIVIFDACRNNPFARNFRSSSPGLARMDAPTGSLIAYATAPGKLAADGGGRNGIYTKHLIKNMKKPGLTIEQVLKNVRVAVLSETGKKQTPWEASSLTGNFYFKSEHKKEESIVKSVTPAEKPAPINGTLFVNTTPEGAKVRILNIKPKFFQGMELSPGKYYIEVQHQEHVTSKQWISIDQGEQKTIDIALTEQEHYKPKIVDGKTVVLTKKDSISLDDIIDASRKKQEEEEQWNQWQQMRDRDYKKVQKIDKDIYLTREHKKEAWRRLLSAISNDNPFSSKDNEMRKYATSRIKFWDTKKSPPKLAVIANKKLRFAAFSDPVSLDPQVVLSGRQLQFSHWVFDPLVRFTQDMKIEPRLATKWERLDELTMRFYLRKNVRFHSGNTFSAKDVKWSFDRMKKSNDFKIFFRLFAGVRIINDYTVDIKTKRPFSLLLNYATYFFAMDSVFYTGTDISGQPKDLIKKFGSSYALNNESGTGAFYVTAHEQGVKLEMKRFKDYWDKNSPGNVDTFLLMPIKENATRVAALLSGDVDMIDQVPPQDYKRLQSYNNTELVTINGGRIIMFQMNQNRVKAFKDARVRNAVVHAINNAGIAKKIMKGTVEVAAQQSPPGYAGYKESLKPRYDLTKAKALMKEAGYEKGFRITMMAPNNRYINDAKIAEASAQMLAKIGIKVKLKTMPKAKYWNKFNARAADMMMMGWHSDTEDSGDFSEFLMMCHDKNTGFGQYNSGYCNKKIDELTIAAQSEIDLVKRAQMLQEIEQILYDDAAFVPYHWQNHAYGAKKNFKIKPILNSMDLPYFGDLVVK